MIYRTTKKQQPIEVEGDGTDRRVKMWVVTGTRDAEGETTRPDAVKAYLDWFINEQRGPMTVNHTNKIVGHWDKAGIGTHPGTGQEGVWLSGVIHRGPGGEDFPNADKAWKMVREGKVKGSSWGGNVLLEETAVDTDTWERAIDNAKVLPYETSLVMDWDDGDDINPSDPNAVPIFFNDRAKTKNPVEKEEQKSITQTEEKRMPDNDEKSVEEDQKATHPETEVYDAEKAVSQLKAELDERFTKMETILEGLKTTKEKAEDEEEDKDKADDKDDDEADKDEDKDKIDEAQVENEVTLTEAQKTAIDKLVEDKIKASINKVKTPAPPVKEPEQVTEKSKYDPNKWRWMSMEDKRKFLKE